MWNLIRLTEKERTVYGVPVVRVGDIKIDCDARTLCALACAGNTVDAGPLHDPVRKLVNCIVARAEPIRCGLLAVACHFGELEEEPEKAFLAHKAARAHSGVLQADVPPGNRYVVEIVKFCLKAHRIANERDPVTGLQGVYKDDTPCWCWTDAAWRRDYRGLKCFCTGITPGFLAEWYALTAGREPACRLPAPRKIKRRLPVEPAIPIVRRRPERRRGR